MPLEHGAKPGSSGFSRNVATEVKAGKGQKQAVAIAYSEAKDMQPVEFAELKALLGKFLGEEAQEPEHKNKDKQGCDCMNKDDDLEGQLASLREDLKDAIRQGYTNMAANLRQDIKELEERINEKRGKKTYRDSKPKRKKTTDGQKVLWLGNRRLIIHGK